MNAVVKEELFGNGQTEPDTQAYLKHDDLFIATHFEAPIVKARGQQESVSPARRFRCRICSSRVKGRDVMRAHLATAHNLVEPDWEPELQQRSLGAFCEFM